MRPEPAADGANEPGAHVALLPRKRHSVEGPNRHSNEAARSPHKKALRPAGSGRMDLVLDRPRDENDGDAAVLCSCPADGAVGGQET